MIKRTLIAAGLTASVVFLGSQSAVAELSDVTVEPADYGSYIVIMKQDPAVAYGGGISGFAATKPAGNAKLATQSAKVQNFTAMLKSEQTSAIRAVGVPESKVIHRYTYALNGFSALMSHEQAQALELRKDVSIVMPDRLYQKQTDNSGSFLGITAPAFPWDASYDGEDVVIGVIDTGIWPEHGSFADDGSYAASPIGDIPCEFGNTEHNEDDVAFECNNKLLGARQMLATYRAVIGADPDEFDSARDDDGHGTHTASTAGGNADVPASILGGDFGLITGVAPRARVVAYKGLGVLGGFGSDLAAAIDQAVADGVDVINYSIGSGSFAIGPDDIAFLFAADAGVHVATSNGNNGPGPATTGSPASVPWVTSVGASTQNRTYQGSAVSSDGWEYFGASITQGTAELTLIDAADAGSELCAPGDLDEALVAGKIVLCLRGGFARVDKSQAVDIAGGAGMILYNQNDGQSEVTDTHWVPSVHINNTDGLLIKDYIAGGDAVAQINGGVFTEIGAPWMAGFSSRGPNRLSPDIIKPDITAPGVNILAGDTPVNRGELFQMISGTSMSSPHIAGIMALMKQAHPDWSPAMVKSAIMTTSYRNGLYKEDGATPADPFDSGAGHVNPSQQYGKTNMYEPGLVYDVGLFEYAAYSCGQDMGIFAEGSCVFLESIGIPSDASDLNLASIGVAAIAGSQTITRTLTSVVQGNKRLKFRPTVVAPPGFKVTVRPKKIRLRGGQSADYTVKFENLGTTGEDWSFGSVTWTDKGNFYSAYSPIAVSGSRFSATPELVTGAGEDGSASIDVEFGYTGSYAASSHGLEAAVVTSDNVVQDPDQSFDPDDGFSNRHDFVLSGSAVFRIELPPESVASPDIDLDVFVYDPSGTQVASSANGGTDESILIRAPVDGTWSVYVHGWQTVGPDADYDLYTWDISGTPGGNMSIDSAPPSATAGESGTVDFSWSGATEGEWHFGLILHYEDGEFLFGNGVEVDNR